MKDRKLKWEDRFKGKKREWVNEIENIGKKRSVKRTEGKINENLERKRQR